MGISIEFLSSEFSEWMSGWVVINTEIERKKTEIEQSLMSYNVITLMEIFFWWKISKPIQTQLAGHAALDVSSPIKRRSGWTILQSAGSAEDAWHRECTWGERAAKLSLVKSCQIQPCWSDFHVVFVSSSASFSCWISMFSWSDPQFCLVRLTIFFGAKSHSCWIKSQLQLDFALSQYLILWVKMQILFIGLLVYILLKSN